MPEEQAAMDALRALGIQKPSPQLIENWLRASRAAEAEETAPAAAPPGVNPHVAPAPPQSAEDFQPKRPRGYSKSNLEPVLRREGALDRPKGIRKPGRPRTSATWFPQVAETMAGGASLPEALRVSGITLDKTQQRALYRNEEFKRLRRRAREEKQQSDPTGY